MVTTPGSDPDTSAAPVGCPDCAAPFDGSRPVRCPACRLPLRGAAAGRLWRIERELDAVAERRALLLRMREEAVEELRALRAAGAQGGDVSDVSDASDGATGDDGARPDARPDAWRGPGAPELSGRSAQAALLVLGGILVSIAALVFTVVSWGHLGIAGRTAVLLAVTGGALTAPRLLLRRGLGGTAETFAAIALALLLLDGYALRAAGLAGLDGVGAAGYWCAVTALTAAGAVAHGGVLRLRVPVAAGFLLARLPGPLLVTACGLEGFVPLATAMVATAAADYPLLRAAAGAVHRDRLPWSAPLVRGAAALAAVWGLLGGLLAATASLAAALDLTGDPVADRLATAGWAWLPLGALALPALAAALPFPGPGLPTTGEELRRPAAGVAGAAVVAAAGGTLAVLLPGTDWVPVAYAAPAALLTLGAGALLRAGRAGNVVPAGLFGAGAVLSAAAALLPVGALLPALAEPLGHLPAAWADGRVPDWDWPVSAAALTGWLLVVATAVGLHALGPASLPRSPWVPALPGTVVDAVTAVAAVPPVALLPVAFGLPYRGAVAVVAVLAVASAGWLLRRPESAGRFAAAAGRPAASAVPATAGLLTLAWALADRPTTIAVLASAAVVTVALSCAGRPAPAVTAALAVLALGAEAVAVGATLRLALPDTALALLGVALATAPVAALLARRPTGLPGPTSLPGPQTARAVESTGYGLAFLALALTAGHPGRLAFALALSAVAASAVALRPDRRRAAAGAAVALLVAASWIRFALWDVRSPEAYSLSVAAALLAVGLLHRRRPPGADSWSAYGPGLAAGLLPSLVALWTDGGWLRPLLLGAAALAVILLGVRSRLQAPLVGGGLALVLVAWHELAPVVVQLLGLLPRWVAPAAAGLLLLALGATYERRLRDARRLGTALRRLG